MLSNFDIIKSCFGPDDDDSEKFEIKNKKQRKISYNPNAKSTKRRKKKDNIEKGYNSEGIEKSKKNIINTNEKKFSIDYTKYKLEKKKKKKRRIKRKIKKIKMKLNHKKTTMKKKKN